MRLTKMLHQLRAFDDRHKWLIDADLTYCSGRYLLMTDNFFFRTSGGYLLHQASEKYLKTLRKIVRSQIDVEKHGHDLKKILNNIRPKTKTLGFDKLVESIEKIGPLEKFRYVDQEANKDIITMENGLKAVDYLVVCVREEIEEQSFGIIDKSISRYLEGSDLKEQNILIDSLLKNNSYATYWINHLSGINSKIDRVLRKYQDRENGGK